MTPNDRIVPADPIGFIRECAESGRVLWTYLVTMRMKDRSIDRGAVLESRNTYELIEMYPDDKYLPSYLVYARKGDRVLHILFAADVPGRNVRVITAYTPNPLEWVNDFKRRKQP